MMTRWTYQSFTARAASLALVALMLNACGGAPVVGPSAISSSGVTIRGALEGQASGSSGELSAFSHTTGVRVSVSGTGISTSTDSSGRFLLNGVPSGTVVLEFSGDGVNGAIELSGLSEGAQISITVSVLGGHATLAERSDDDSDSDDKDSDDEDSDDEDSDDEDSDDEDSDDEDSDDEDSDDEDSDDEDSDDEDSD